MRRRSQPSPDQRRSALRERIHIMAAYEAAFARWPEVSALAFDSESASAFCLAVGKLLDLDTHQATAIADMQIRRLGRLERGSMAQDLADLRGAWDALEP